MIEYTIDYPETHLQLSFLVCIYLLVCGGLNLCVEVNLLLEECCFEYSVRGRIFVAQLAKSLVVTVPFG